MMTETPNRISTARSNLFTTYFNISIYTASCRGGGLIAAACKIYSVARSDERFLLQVIQLPDSRNKSVIRRTFVFGRHRLYVENVFVISHHIFSLVRREFYREFHDLVESVGVNSLSFVFVDRRSARVDKFAEVGYDLIFLLIRAVFTALDLLISPV